LSKKTTLILAVLLFGLLAWAIVAGAPSGPDSPVPSLFLEFDRADVTGLDIRNPRGDIHLERDPGDAERWRVTVGKTLVRASSVEVEDLLLNLSRLRPRNRWTPEEIRSGERTAWGMDAPTVTVRFGLASGSLRADFGNRTSENMNVYAERDQDGSVYVVPVETVAAVEILEAVELREKKVVGVSTFDVASFTLERDDGVRFEAMRASGGTWEAVAPWKGAVDPVPMEEFLAPILNVKIEEFVADGAPDLDRYGLLKPRAVLTLRRKGEERNVVLRLGSSTPEGGAYFMEEGEDSVYLCGRELPEAVAGFDPAALRDRNALRLGWVNLESIEYAAGEDSWKLLKVLERWDVERPERVPAEDDRVKDLLETLRNLEVVDFIDGADPADLGLGDPASARARLVLKGTDGTGDRHLLLGERDADGNAPARLLPRPDASEAGALFVLPGEFLDRLEEGWLSFRTLEIWHLHQDEVRGMTRTWQGRTESFAYADRVWSAVEGGPEPDAAALNLLLAHLLEIHATGWSGPVEGAPEAWGIGDPPAGPVFTFRLEEDGEVRERSLVLGAAVEEGGAHYGRLADGKLVFRLPDQLLDGAELKPFWEMLTGGVSK
jgi:hypothetical protein